MAVRLPSSSLLQFPTRTHSVSSSSCNPNLPQPALTLKTSPQFLSLNLLNQSKTTTTRRRRSRRDLHCALIKAIEEGKEEIPTTTNEAEKNETLETSSSSSGVDELGAEIKETMKNIKERENDGGEGGGDLWSGVAEEIKEIEWPVFGKVLGITGVVLGVIAGSSVVLLTVNAVLAELSDQVFAGKGVQDFFG